MKISVASASSALFLLLSAAPVWSQDAVTPAIAGVVSAGTPIKLIKEGLEAVEGPVPQADGSLLFSNNRAGQVLRVAPDDSISTWYQGAGGANGLTLTKQGEVAGTLTEMHAIGIVKQGTAPRVLVDNFEGTPFNRPNDLVASKRGDIYFSDTAPLNAATAPPLPSAVYQYTVDGKTVRVSADVARPNGVALSPDERTLYVANTVGDTVVAFDLDRKGRAGKHRDFARLTLPPTPAAGPAPNGSGSDGLAVDEKGRLFVATTVGVQVFSPKGEALGTIVLPKIPQNLAFAGPDRSSLFVVGRGAVYRIATQTRGPHRPGK